MLARVHTGSMALQTAQRRRVAVQCVAAAAILLAVGAVVVPSLGSDRADRGQVANPPSAEQEVVFWPPDPAIMGELAVTLYDPESSGVSTDLSLDLARTQVLALAAVVEFDTAEVLTFPFQLGYVPDGLQPIDAVSRYDSDGNNSAYLSLGDGSQGAPSSISAPPTGRRGWRGRSRIPPSVPTRLACPNCLRLMSTGNSSCLTWKDSASRSASCHGQLAVRRGGVAPDRRIDRGDPRSGN